MPNAWRVGVGGCSEPCHQCQRRPQVAAARACVGKRERHGLRRTVVSTKKVMEVFGEQSVCAWSAIVESMRRPSNGHTLTCEKSLEDQ